MESDGERKRVDIMPRQPKYKLYRKKGRKSFTLGKSGSKGYYGTVEGINLKRTVTSKKTLFSRPTKLIKTLFGGM